MGLQSYLTMRKWRLLGAMGWANRRVDKQLAPAPWPSVTALDIATSTHCLTVDEYNEFVSTPSGTRLRKFGYPHSKAIEYLTSITLGELQAGEVLLDAAGGADAEFVRMARDYLSFSFVGYSQDAQLDGTERDGIRYVGGSIDAVPLPDASIDLISCHHSFEHFRGDIDTAFIREASRLMKPGGRTVITPLFLTNRYAEIWNGRAVQHFDNAATQIVDHTASFPGWGPYEGFARTYDIDAFGRRVIAALPADVTASVCRITLDDQPAPDPKTNKHIPILNREMKALVLRRR
jgi:SAM-dependent methyltransferase